MKKWAIIGCIILIIMLEIPITTAINIEKQTSKEEKILSDLDREDSNKIQITLEELKTIRDTIEEVKNRELNKKLINILDESLTNDKNECIWLNLSILEQGLNEISAEEIVSTDVSASFVFAHISGSVNSHTKQDEITHIQGSLTISGLGTVYTYPGEIFGFHTISSSHAKTNIFIGILNDNRVNGVGLNVVIDYNKKADSKNKFFTIIYSTPLYYTLSKLISNST